MSQNIAPVPPIPLGMLVAAATDLPLTDAGGAARVLSCDDRFALQRLVVDGAGVATAAERHPHWCGILLDDALRDAVAGVDSGWAAALDVDDALLPVEFIEGLRDEQLAESFVARVLCYSGWRELQRAGLSLAALQGFFARHKYLLMSRHIGSYQQLGQLLANRGSSARPLDELARQAIALIMAALRRPTTRGGHGNALAHIRGYLKNRLGPAEKSALDEALEWYRLGLVPVHTPLDLLREYFARYPDAYIDQQVYMQRRLHERFDPAALLDELRAAGAARHSAGDR
jgi:uncharacterized protein YbgA (DUF1722 family)